MRAILKVWILCGVLLSVFVGGSFLSGCSGIRNAAAVQPIDFYALQGRESASGFAGADEIWILPRNFATVRVSGETSDSGSLLAKFGDDEVPMPLRHTDVKAAVNGWIGTVDVTQQFENPYTKTIDVAYSFPLPHTAAVRDFIMTIGKRHIRGIIRERKEAEAIYEEARRQGYRATLLTEERPNIFKQSIANVEPGSEIDVHIQYIQTVDYVNGWHEFVFPMVIKTNSTSDNLERDASDISLGVDVEAGVPIEEVECKTHAIAKTILSTNHFAVRLASSQKIPNKDFILRYRVAGDQIRAGLITHHDERGGYFTLMLYPPKEVGNPVQPALTHIRLNAGAVQLFDVFPSQTPDLIYGRTVAIAGRFEGATLQKIRVKADSENGPVEFEISAIQDEAGARSGLPNIWARMKIADLVEQSAYGPNPQLPREINQVALDYGLVSPFTGFVAVDASGATDGNGN